MAASSSLVSWLSTTWVALGTPFETLREDGVGALLVVERQPEAETLVVGDVRPLDRQEVLRADRRLEQLRVDAGVVRRHADLRARGPRRREQDRREQDRSEEGRVAAARGARDLVWRFIQRRSREAAYRRTPLKVQVCDRGTSLEERHGRTPGRSAGRSAGRSPGRSAGRSPGRTPRVDVDGEPADAGAPDDVDEVDDVAVGDAPIGGDDGLEVRISRQLAADEAQDGLVVARRAVQIERRRPW